MLEECKKGNHKLTVIQKKHLDFACELSVVKWCKICGSVVVDLEIDNRIFPGHRMTMMSPLISKESK